MLTTRQKLAFLEKHLTRWYKKWNTIHPGNIVGYRIDKKIVGGKKTRNYAIVFHVKRKRKEDRLKGDEIIPKSIRIKFPDGQFRNIKTDVEETGTFQFHVGSCRKQLNNGYYSVGTAGVFLQDNSQNIYALTNYHVVGWDLMTHGQFYFQGADSQNLTVNNRPSVFREGILSNQLDAAFIFIPGAPQIPLNIMADGTAINGFITGPISSSIIGKTVRIYSNTKNGVAANVVSNSGIFYTGFEDISITNAIVLPACTIKGDSGAAVLVGNYLLGIVTGADNNYTYVIPYYKIRNFKPLDIA